MHFDDQTVARIAKLWIEISEVSRVRSNLWDESWEAPLQSLEHCYKAAIKAPSIEAWQTVVIHGRALRASLDQHDGSEHRLYVATTRITDLLETAMDALAKEGRSLVTPDQVERLIDKVQHLEHAIAEDRASRKHFEIETKRTLEVVAAKLASAKKARVHLEGVSLKQNALSATVAEAFELLTGGRLFRGRSEVEGPRTGFERIGKVSLALVLIESGKLLQRLGMFAKSAEALRRSTLILDELEDQDRLPLVLNRLGLVLIRSGDLTEATKAFRQSFDLNMSLANEYRHATIAPIVLDSFRPEHRETAALRKVDPGPKHPALESSSQRKLNAWISNSRPKVFEVFRVSINISGDTKGAAASIGFPEPECSEAESLDLLVSVSCLNCSVLPSWRELQLPRTGDSKKIDFLITSRTAGEHEFTVRVYLAKQMIELQSLRFTVTVAEASPQPAEAL